MPDDDVAEDEMDDGDAEDVDVKAGEDDDVESDDVKEEDVGENDQSQDRDPHFLRAFCVSQEQLCPRIYKYNAAVQSRGPQSLLSRHLLGPFTRAFLCGSLQERCPGPDGTP